jgi:hypothetical protein
MKRGEGVARRKKIAPVGGTRVRQPHTVTTQLPRVSYLPGPWDIPKSVTHRQPSGFNSWPDRHQTAPVQVPCVVPPVGSSKANGGVLGLAPGARGVAWYHLKPETAQIFWWAVAALFGALAIVSGFFANYYGTKKSAGASASPSDVRAIVTGELANLYARLPAPERIENEKYPGVSINIVLRLHEIHEPRRKYLLDFGEHRGGRLSIYLDPNNVFTVSLIDLRGEQYAVRAPTGIGGVQFNQFLYLNCEVGIRERSTFLRVLVDGREIGNIDIPSRIDAGAISIPGSVTGADIDGANGAAFDEIESAIFTMTLTTAEIGSLLQYFQSKNPQNYLEFDGHQWMRADEHKNLRQDRPELQPQLRQLQRM